MDVTTSSILSGGIVIAGMWAEGKGINAHVMLGAGFLAVFLSVLSSINDDLARGFALLVLIGVLLRFGLVILKKAGLAK